MQFNPNFIVNLGLAANNLSPRKKDSISFYELMQPCNLITSRRLDEISRQMEKASLHPLVYATIYALLNSSQSKKNQIVFQQVTLSGYFVIFAP